MTHVTDSMVDDLASASATAMRTHRCGELEANPELAKAEPFKTIMSGDRSMKDHWKRIFAFEK